MAVPEGRLVGCCILVAEDGWLLASLVADLIAQHGGTVAGPVRTQAEGRAVLDETTVHCAIVDIGLGDGLCYPFLDLLRRRDIPAVILTGYPFFSIPEPFRRLPIFTKPCDLEEVIDCVAERCRTASGSATARESD